MFWEPAESRDSKIPEIQAFRDFRNSGDSGVPGIQEFQGLRNSRDSGIPRIQEFQEFRGSGIQEFQEFRNSGIQKFQEFQNSRDSEVPGITEIQEFQGFRNSRDSRLWNPRWDRGLFPIPTQNPGLFPQFSPFSHQIPHFPPPLLTLPPSIFPFFPPDLGAANSGRSRGIPAPSRRTLPLSRPGWLPNNPKQPLGIFQTFQGGFG